VVSGRLLIIVIYRINKEDTMPKILMFLLPLGLKLLGRLSAPARGYIEAGFDKLIALAKEKTATTIDESVLSLLKAVLIGGVYESTGTGLMERILVDLISKLSPLARKSLYDFLCAAELWAKTTNPIVDDIVVWFVRNLLFPDGDPGGEGVNIEAAVKATEEAADIVYSELSTAPGCGPRHNQEG
jgi:hypothetical protein